jgi:hypothetical protein
MSYDDDDHDHHDRGRDHGRDREPRPLAAASRFNSAASADYTISGDEDSHANAYNHTLAAVSDIEKLSQKKGANPLDERFRVSPDQSYPNTFFNREELRQEMNRKSVYFHDTRGKSDKGLELGQLRVEVLQCFGIPTNSIMRETSAYCIAVCGSHAFKTDVMPPVANPMWLCKMRRASLFPLFHAYARLFLGVFDNSSYSSSDSSDFVGRVVIDVARLRPGCSYDLTLPLRQSSSVFTRQQQGAVRVRIHLVWHSERAALLSYIPKTKPKFKPQEKINISCLDERSFRNVANTVHGIHMPGKFSMSLLKATVREINFTRIHVMRYLRKREMWNLVYWQYPVISGFVFLAWMHSVYANTVRFVPGHIMTYLLLHLYKNYAYYGMDSPLQNGFMAPTIEELGGAVIFGNRKAKKRYLEPLNMEMDNSHAVNPMEHLDAADDYEEANTGAVPLSEVAESMRKSIRVQEHKYRLKTYRNCFLGNEAVDFLCQFGYAYSRPEAVALGRRLARETRLFEHVARKHDFEDRPFFYQFLAYDTKKYIIKGHRPRGKRLLRLLGFVKDDDALLTTRGHVEFPFATGQDHPRFTVKEALVIRSAEAKKILKEEEKAQDVVDCAEFGIVPSAGPDPAAKQFITNAAGEVVNVAGDVLNLGADVLKAGIGAGIGAVRSGVRRGSLLVGMNTNVQTTDAAKELDEAGEKGTPDKPKRSSILGMTSPTANQAPAPGVEFGDPDDVYSKLKSRNNPTLDELLERQETANAYDKYAYDSDEDVQDMFKKRSKGVIIEEKILKKPPNQDMGVKTGSADKSFAKTISEARHKAHGLLLHLFNDRTYTVDAHVFPPTLPDEADDRESVASKATKKKKKKFAGRLSAIQGKDKDKEREEEEDKKKKRVRVTPYDARVDEYDKILMINKYSHANPWINRVGVIVQPIVEIVQGWIYLFRSLFNIFTWQDPILSFWVAFLGPAVVLVSHFMPYRILFFVAGVMVVGPQNYMLRLFRESKGDPPPNFDKLIKKKKPQKEERQEETQYFSSEAPGNQNIKYVNVEPKQVKNIVVPYGPLKYNRFYDWPPEPQYARVYASPPPRNNLGTMGDYYSEDDDLSSDEGFQVDATLVSKQKKKKKKKGIKKLASQVKKGTGTVVFAGGELANRTRKGAVGLTSNVAKGTVNVTRGAVKGTVKGTGKIAGKAVKGTAKVRFECWFCLRISSLDSRSILTFALLNGNFSIRVLGACSNSGSAVVLVPVMMTTIVLKSIRGALVRERESVLVVRRVRNNE